MLLGFEPRDAESLKAQALASRLSLAAGRCPFIGHIQARKHRATVSWQVGSSSKEWESSHDQFHVLQGLRCQHGL